MTQQIKLILILSSYFTSASLAQGNLFKEYGLQNVGYISIPAIMEIQSGNYREISEAYQRSMAKRLDYEVSDDRVVFQQKGLNNFKQSSLSTYARMIVETQIGNFGDYEKITTLLTASSSELNDLSAEFERQIRKSFQNTNLRLINWYGVSITKVNGRTALKISYLRQLVDRPFVVVNIYRFQNNDRMHSITVSYRQSDEMIWKPLLNKAVGSLTITNVR